MNHQQKRFFIALLPPLTVQTVANEIKQYFAEHYHSKAAQKSPPHVTLQPPFDWQIESLSQLSEFLTQFAQNHASIPMTLDGFAAFKPRVIYINVLRNSELLDLQQQLMSGLETCLNIVHLPSKTRLFKPHLTVAFRDLKKSYFYQAWDEFKDRNLHFEFTVSQLTLLIHNGRQWEIFQEFSFKQPEH